MNPLLESKEFKFVVSYFESMDWTNREIYANWLAQTYYFVSHSVRLSALGAAKLPVDSSIGKRMIAHTMEETGHHVVAQKDIEALGRSIHDLPALGVTKAFYESQYYKVMFENPQHLLGQIFMLEALSVAIGPMMYEKVLKSFGEKATRFVKVHAFEDVDHVAKAQKAIESFSDEMRAGTEQNFYQACEMYFLILKSVNESSFAKLVETPKLTSTKPGLQPQAASL